MCLTFQTRQKSRRVDETNHTIMQSNQKTRCELNDERAREIYVHKVPIIVYMENQCAHPHNTFTLMFQTKPPHSHAYDHEIMMMMVVATHNISVYMIHKTRSNMHTTLQHFSGICIALCTVHVFSITRKTLLSTCRHAAHHSEDVVVFPQPETIPDAYCSVVQSSSYSI